MKWPRVGEFDRPTGFKIYNDNVYLLPLHLQIIPWAMRANMSAIHRADNWLEVPWVVIK
ncbi:MAG: hypothetical protein LW865_17310 [Betaproteobacteria bacterium]|nr:hypothetical protein [Betaproteobacteria bacterium]